jgi:hypothetical protein
VRLQIRSNAPEVERMLLCTIYRASAARLGRPLNAKIGTSQQEYDMSPKIALPFVALALGTVFVSAPAIAQQDPLPPAPGQWTTNSDIDPNIARILAESQGYYNYAPGPTLGLGLNAGPSASAWCQARFRTYNPATGMFRGSDGNFHHCP